MSIPIKPWLIQVKLGMRLMMPTNWSIFTMRWRGVVRSICATILFLAPATFVDAAGTGADRQAVKEEATQVHIYTVFDNYRVDPELETGWGFASVVTTAKATVLFDTGANDAVLLANMRKMELDLWAVKAIVISHAHGDHLGGLEGFLAENSDVTVHIPASFPDSVRRMIRDSGAEYTNVAGTGEIVPGVYTTGALGNGIDEQALVVDTNEGLVVMTGCAHPGIVRIVEAAHEQHPDRPIALVMGGFHLLSAGESEIRRVVQALRDLGVKRVAPSHCTGDAARRQFQKAFGEDYIAGGAGNRMMLR